MNINLKLIIFLFFLGNNILAQNNFIKLADHSGHHSLHSVRSIRNAYYTLLNFEQDSMALLKYDNDGHLIKKVIIQDFYGVMMNNYNNQEDLILFGLRIGTVSKLMVFDTNLIVKHDLEFYSYGSYFNFGSAIDIGDGFIVHTEVYNTGSSGDTTYIFRADYDGNIIWEKKFRHEDWPYVATPYSTLVESGDGEFVVTGRFVFFDNIRPNPQGSAFIFRFDRDGNIKFNRRYTPIGRFHPSKYGSIGISNGNYVVAETKDSVVFFPEEWASDHPYFVAYNSKDELIWNTPVFFYMDEGVEWAFRTLSTGNIIYLTTSNDPIYFPKRYEGIRIINLNPNGTLKWQRLYIPPEPYKRDTIEFMDIAFTSAEELSDGGILLVGWYDYEIIRTKQHMSKGIMIKLDSLGCLIPGCTNISNALDDIFTGILEIDKKNELTLYPVPAQDKLFISGMELDHSMYYTILDMDGKVYENKKLEHQYIDTRNIIPGMYILHLKSKNGTHVLKFIKY